MDYRWTILLVTACKDTTFSGRKRNQKHKKMLKETLFANFPEFGFRSDSWAILIYFRWHFGASV
jgi:hypothetical protein